VSLTSRERVLLALNHEEADRIPIDFGAMRSTGISMTAYMKLREKLGVTEGRPKLYDLMQWLAEPELPVLERLHGDVIQLHRYSPTFGLDIGAWKEWTTPDGCDVLVPHGFDPVLMPDGSRVIMDGDTVIARMPKDGHWFDLEYNPLANATTYSDIDNYQFPTISDEEIEFLSREAKRLHDETDYAILASFGGNIFEAGQFDFGWANFMALLAGNPDLAMYYMDKLADRLGMDPAQLRLLNAAREGDNSPTQVTYTQSNFGNIEACISRLKEIMQWDNGICTKVSGRLRLSIAWLPLFK